MPTSSPPTRVPGTEWSGGMDSQDAASKFNSAAAFVESGIQEVYEDSCSICLEVFTEEEPLTMTTCNHEFHLQCILEWAQRRQECPMCWQPLSLRDPESQELLAACSHERAFHSSSVSTTSMLRSAFEDFELQHRYSTSYPEEADLERRIMQHLAAAASGMSRARLAAGASLGTLCQGVSQGGQQIVGNSAESTTPNGRVAIQAGTLVVGNNSRTSSPDMGGRGASPSGLTSAFRLSMTESGEHEDPRVDSVCATSAPASPRLNRGSVLGFLPMDGESQGSSEPSRLAGAEVVAEGFQPLRAGGGSQNWSSNDSREGSGPQRAAEATGHVQNNGGDLSTLGDALKSRWAAASTRYRETLTKSTRSFREKLRLRGGTVADISAKAREVGAGVVRAIERMSDPGPSSSDRANNDDNEGENTVTHSNALEGGTPDRLQSPGNSFSNPSPDPSSPQVDHQRTHERLSDGDAPQPSTAHCPYQHQVAVVSESPEKGVQAGSVATSGRLNINGDDDMEEIPLKVAADSVTESQRTTPTSPPLAA